jgi:phosphoribosylglycinamide formyltransferase-1
MVALARAARANRLGGGKITVVICSDPAAAGIGKALRLGLPVVVIDPRDFSGRVAHEAAVLETLRRFKVKYILLAGYMRILTPTFFNGWKNRILNTHPALLPAFRGAHGVRDALAWGAKVSGCTIHFVEPAIDDGPVILQKAVPVLSDDSEKTLAARILKAEHKAYPEAVRALCEGRLAVRGRRVIWKS